MVSRHASVRLRPDPAAAKIAREKASILVVDDDEANRDIFVPSTAPHRI
jgi:hypothetical protein